MSPSTKIFATLSLSAAVGKKIQTIDESETRAALGESLYNVGYEATGKYPYPELTASKKQQIYDAVQSLLSGPTEPEALLSMLIAGLIDIHAKCKPARQTIANTATPALTAWTRKPPRWPKNTRLFCGK